MPGRYSIPWFYALGIGFIAAGTVGTVYGFLYIWLFPLVLLTALLALYRADILIYATAFLAPLSVTIQDLGFGAGLIVPSEPVIILLMLVSVLKLAHEGFVHTDFMRHPLTIAVLIHLGWLIITSIGSTMPVVSFKYLVSRLWYVVVFYFFASRLFYGRIDHQLRFIWILLWSAILVVGFVMVRHSTWGFTRDAVSTVIQPFFWIHGVYAAMVAFLVPVLFILAYKGREFLYSPLRRSFLIFFCLVFIAAVIFSYTRAAWLSVLAAAVVCAILLLRIRLSVIYTAVAVVLLGLLYYQSDILMELSRNKTGSDSKSMERHLQSATNIRNDPSNLERINRWSCAYRMFRDKPVLGFGPGTYMFQYAPYQLSYQKTVISTNFHTLGHAHSEWLGPLAETGLIGMLSWLAVYVIAFIRALSLIYYSKDRRVRYLSMALFLALFTYFVHGFLNSYFEYDKIAVPFWAFVSMIVCLDLVRKKEESGQEVG